VKAFYTRKNDMKLHSSNSKVRKSGPLLAGITAAAAGLAVSGLYVREEIRRAERDHPSAGNFMNVNGVLLHFIDTNGSNPALVIFHGNGAMISDMQISGLLGRAAEKYRVILFDRPGYGYSDRPSDRTWGPFEQADLFHRALAQLGVVRPLIFGHSSGTQVALAMALDFPDDVGGLVLASGYYFPTPRADALSAAPVTIPVLGDFLRHTIIPLVGRLTAAGMFRKMFAPQPVPPRFLAEFPVGLTLRPSQLKANSEETVLMISAASKLEDRYDELHCPVCIMTGATTRSSTPSDNRSVCIR
jgi:pimeloyl-ACP methyl ester carboxylesterase